MPRRQVWQRSPFLRGTLGLLTLGMGVRWGVLGDSLALYEQLKAIVERQLWVLTGGGG